MNAAGGTLLTPLTLGQPPPLPAMTDDRHADALGVTRRERWREYQGAGGRDEEAPAPEGAEAPRRHETANPRIRGEDTALRAVKYPHIGSPPINRELPHCFNPRPPEGRATTAGAVACFNPRQPPRMTARAMQAQAPTAQSIGADG